MNPYHKGVQGEQAAEEYLCRQGMTVLKRRYRGNDGEIDLIMKHGHVIVFVEVKSRPRGHAGEGLTAVTAAKKRRMIHAAMSFLVEREYLDHPVRFDVVELTGDGILYVPNAFTADMQ